MEAQLLQDAINEYAQSLESIVEALEANPGEAELLELKDQLEVALQDAEAALAGLHGTREGAAEAADTGAPAAEAEAVYGTTAAPAVAGPPIGPAAGPPERAALARGAAPARGNARIHPRSKYAFEAPDFAALARLYPSLHPFLLPPPRTQQWPSSSTPDLPADTTAANDEQEAGGAGGEVAAAGLLLPSSDDSGFVASTSAPIRASLDFTDPAACRELTRVLLRHDFGVEWWVPLGQLVPPVTNRVNYVHWLEDLLALSAPPGHVAGLDIGCGANLIYPLLGAALCGWRMVGADVTPQALTWAAANLGANPQLNNLVELRGVEMQPEQQAFHKERIEASKDGKGASTVSGNGTGTGNGGGGSGNRPGKASLAAAAAAGASAAAAAAAAAAGASASAAGAGASASAAGAGASAASATAGLAAAGSPAGDGSQPDPPPAEITAAAPAHVARLAPGAASGRGIVSGAVRTGERFAFCMCNPPFFEGMEEAGRNPATAFGGTAEEMVYPGGELGFVSAMVQDSLTLRGAVHWYTTMVGKKGTLKAVRSLLYRHGVRVLRTTELAQGKTSRWALAWSFTADPAAASQPLARFPSAAAAAAAPGNKLPRAAGGGPVGQQQTGQQQGVTRAVGRKLSWQVQAPARSGVAVLDVVRQCLRGGAVQCRDTGPYCLRGSYAPTVQELAGAAADGTGDSSELARDAKRHRRDAGSDGGSQGDKQAQQAQRWQVDFQLFQQHAGLFLLTAVLHKSAPQAALPWFGQMAQRLHSALAAHWVV